MFFFPCVSTPCPVVWKPQAVFSRKFTKVRMRMTSLTDERVKLTNQAITGARFMKINAWEPALEKEIRRQGRPERITSSAIDLFVYSYVVCPSVRPLARPSIPSSSPLSLSCQNPPVSYLIALSSFNRGAPDALDRYLVKTRVVDSQMIVGSIVS